MTQGIIEPFYILSLDGGGSLGVYTLGVLEQVEKLVGKPLSQKFGLIYGTSTGSIIGSLLALGKSVSEISDIYFNYIPRIMTLGNSSERSKALKECAYANEVFGNKKFDHQSFKTYNCVVSTNYQFRRPMIFKSSTNLFIGGIGVPGFGCTISDAVVASCSAYPFFERPIISTVNLGELEMLDGGFVANNPTLFAITDAVQALGKSEDTIRVLNIGVGNYPRAETSFWEKIFRIIKITSSSLDIFETTLAANNNTIDGLRKILFSNILVERVSDSETRQEYATNLLESSPEKLTKINNFGRQSFMLHRTAIESLLS
jgi:patatin-like phospholipase/acyl hydrolase